MICNTRGSPSSIFKNCFDKMRIGNADNSIAFVSRTT